MEDKYKLYAIIIIIIIIIIYKYKKQKKENLEKKSSKPYKKKVNNAENDEDNIELLSKKLYKHVHELFMDDEDIDEDDLKEINENFDEILLMNLKQLYENKDPEKIKPRDYKKLIKKNL